MQLTVNELLFNLIILCIFSLSAKLITLQWLTYSKSPHLNLDA